jgi:lipopolysaccharide/colanic/teichoic acid biosynthesis glycosyltransferase
MILSHSLLIALNGYSFFGIFTTNSIGQNGNKFKIFKIKSMLDGNKSILVKCGFTKKRRMNHQLFNIFSVIEFCGATPDIAGYTTLVRRRATDFKVKPGLTSEASKYF